MMRVAERWSEQDKEAKLPLRDWAILPLLSLVTVLLCLLAVNMAAHHLYETRGGNACMVEDAVLGVRYCPNCTARLKTSEGPWVEQHYNACGYRSQQECGAKPAGATRIALLGSYLAEGEFVAYERAFAGQTEVALTQILSRPVEVQNLSVRGCMPICSFHRIDEALALKPDVLVMAIDPFDVEHVEEREGLQGDRAGSDQPGETSQGNEQNPVKRLKLRVEQSAVGVMAEHYLLQDSNLYARIFLHYGDRADYLRTPLSPAWKRRMRNLDHLLAEMKSKADKAGVPFVLVEVPSLAQAAVVKMPEPPAGVDPYLFNRALKQVAGRNGMGYADPLEHFYRADKVANLYYVVDTHLNAQGHTLVSQALVNELREQYGRQLQGQIRDAAHSGVSSGQ